MRGNQPNHIFLIVADSLRYDSVFQSRGTGLDYIAKHAKQFSNVSSPACWTLPATASLFTGMLPHEHQATTQTRSLNPQAPTIAEVLKSQGYKTYQITSNVATTEIFGLDKGFDKVIKTWDLAEKKGLKPSQLFMLLGKRRIRKKLFTKDAISASLSKDIRAGSVWFRSYYHLVFEHAQQLMAEHEQRGEKVFIFLNLMETHFPYHIDTEFKFSSGNPIKRVQELKTLWNIVNQSFLTNQKGIPPQDKLQIVQSRQKKSWQLIASDLDAYVRSLHENKNNLVIFTSDHGENFGDQNWVYHFSNVTDACTRVPLFWLDAGDDSNGVYNHSLSSRNIYNEIIKRAGVKVEDGAGLFEENIFSTPISQSYWYDNHGKTLPRFKYNQFCFSHEGYRYLYRNDSWLRMPTTDYQSGMRESLFEDFKKDSPIEELIQEEELRSYLNEKLRAYKAFENKIPK